MTRRVRAAALRVVLSQLAVMRCSYAAPAAGGSRPGAFSFAAEPEPAADVRHAGQLFGVPQVCSHCAIRVLHDYCPAADATSLSGAYGACQLRTQMLSGMPFAPPPAHMGGMGGAGLHAQQASYGHFGAGFGAAGISEQASPARAEPAVLRFILSACLQLICLS
jgi:hypothetical protein